MGWRPWIFERVEKNGVGFTSNGASRWEWRRFRLAFFLMLGLSLLGFVVMQAGIRWVARTSAALPSGGMPSMWPTMLVVVGPSVVAPAVFLLMLFSSGRAKKSAESVGGYACPNCLHDLSAAPVERCSECGQRVVYDALPTLWTRKVKRRFFGSSETRFDETGFDERGLSRFESRTRAAGMLVAVLVPLGAFGPSAVVDYLSMNTAIEAGWIGGPWRGSLLGLLGILVCVGPLMVFSVRRTKQLRRSLAMSGGVSCPRCLADLSGSAEGPCSWCGQRVARDGMKRLWRVRMMTLGMDVDQAEGCSYRTDGTARDPGAAPAAVKKNEG